MHELNNTIHFLCQYLHNDHLLKIILSANSKINRCHYCLIKNLGEKCFEKVIHCIRFAHVRLLKSNGTYQDIKYINFITLSSYNCPKNILI